MESDPALDGRHSQDARGVLSALSAVRSVPDAQLLQRLTELVSRSRRIEADVVAHVGEVEYRRLYAREACPSMFVYCTDRLHLSEAEAYLRINVARAARKHEVLLDMLRDGRLHLSGIVRLLPVLTRDNRDTLLARAAHRSKRQILELVAELARRPDAPASIRKLPGSPRASAASAASQHPPVDPKVASESTAVPLLEPAVGRELSSTQSTAGGSRLRKAVDREAAQSREPRASRNRPGSGGCSALNAGPCITRCCIG